MSVWLNTPLITNSAGKIIYFFFFNYFIIAKLLQLQNYYFHALI